MRRLLFLLLSLCTFQIVHAQSEQELFQRADSLLTLGQYKEAIPLYDRVIRMNDSNEHYFRGRGYSYIQMGENAKGKADYQMALKINPSCARCYMNLARIETSDLRAALDLMSKAVKLDNKDPQIYNIRAQIHERMGNKIEALVDYNYAIQAAPKDPGAYVAKGIHYLNNGEPASALQNFNQALAIDSTFGRAYFNRGRYYTEVGDWNAAVKEMTRAIDLGVRDIYSYTGRGSSYARLERHRDALADFDTVLMLSPDYALGYMNRGMTRYALEDMDGSCEDSKKALERMLKQNTNDPMVAELRMNLEDHCDPSRVSYFYHRGIAEFNKNDFKKAIMYYESGLKKFPNNASLIYYRGNANLLLGNYKKAVRDYESTVVSIDSYLADLRLNPRYQLLSPEAARQLRSMTLASVYSDMARARAGLNDSAGAFTSIARAMGEAPGTPVEVQSALYYTRGLLLLAVDKSGDAMEDFERAIELNPLYVPPYVNLAIIYMNLADREQIRVTTFTVGHQSGLATTQGSVSMVEREGGMKRTEQGYIAVDRRGANPFHLAFPVGVKRIERSENADKALDLCNKAIAADPALAQAYLVRGYLKMRLGESEYCSDLIRARDLGAPEAERMVGELCK